MSLTKLEENLSIIENLPDAPTMEYNELKQKLNEKDNLIKKQDEELKEKDRTIEQLERFKDDCKDKEIEKLKISNEQKDNEIGGLKAELEELKKLSLKNKEIENKNDRTVELRQFLNNTNNEKYFSFLVIFPYVCLHSPWNVCTICVRWC